MEPIQKTKESMFVVGGGTVVDQVQKKLQSSVEAVKL